jgi:hypothetical protein
MEQGHCIMLLEPISILAVNLNTAIRGGTVGAALAVVRHGGLQRQWLSSNGLLPIAVFGVNGMPIGESKLNPGLCSKISKRRGMFLDLAEDGVHPGALLAG